MTVLCAFLTNFCLFLAEEQEGIFSFLPEFFTRSRSLHQGYNLFQSPSSYTRRNKHEEKLVQTGQEIFVLLLSALFAAQFFRKQKRGEDLPNSCFWPAAWARKMSGLTTIRDALFRASTISSLVIHQKNVRIDNNQRRLRRWRTSSSSSAMRSRRSTTMVPPRVESSKSPHSLSSFLTRNMSLI